MDAFLIEKGEQAHGPNDEPCALKERTGGFCNNKPSEASPEGS
jgi:hypothetical protein